VGGMEFSEKTSICFFLGKQTTSINNRWFQKAKSPEKNRTSFDSINRFWL